MLEKGLISSFQMAVMLYPTVLATGFLALPTLGAQYAGNDLWMPGILSAALGYLSLWLAIGLHERYPRMTVIEYSQKILGRWLGQVIGIVYFLMLCQIGGTILRQYSEFVVGNFLFRTPLLFVVGSILLLAGIAVRGGVELLARSAVILTPIFLLPLGFLILLIPDLQVANMFPLLDKGLVPVLKGTLAPQSWVSELFLATFFLPALTDKNKAWKWGNLALLTIIASLTYVNFIVLFLLGPDTGDKIYPVLVAFRYINVTNFFENLEALLLAMWVVGNYVKIGVFYYAAVLSLSQVLRLSDYRPVVFPIGLLLLVLSLWDFPNFTFLAEHLKFVGPFNVTVITTVIPLLLWIVAILRKKNTQHESSASAREPAS